MLRASLRYPPPPPPHISPSPLPSPPLNYYLWCIYSYFIHSHIIAWLLSKVVDPESKFVSYGKVAFLYQTGNLPHITLVKIRKSWPPMWPTHHCKVPSIFWNLKPLENEDYIEGNKSIKSTTKLSRPI